MRVHTAKPTYQFAGILACIAMIMMALPAHARSDYNRSINLAARQWQLVEQMTNSTMLAVLGIDTELNIRNVRQARDLFSSTLRGLRNGDEELGLAPTEQPEVLSEISRIEAFWPRYDQMLQNVITSVLASSEVSDMQVRQLTDIHALMIESVERTVGAFEQFSHGGETHSILSSTLNASGQLRNHSQLMLGELLAIAYRNQEAQSRRELGQAAREFNRTLTGLIQGDAELRILPAPNDEIKAELAKVQRLWSEIAPILEGVASGAEVDQQSIAKVSRYATRMILPLNMTTLMYENL